MRIKIDLLTTLTTSIVRLQPYMIVSLKNPYIGNAIITEASLGLDHVSTAHLVESMAQVVSITSAAFPPVDIDSFADLMFDEDEDSVSYHDFARAEWSGRIDSPECRPNVQNITWNVL